MAPTATTDQPLFAGPATGKNSNAQSRIQVDPELVSYPSFPDQPTTAEQFYTRAYQVSDLLHQDAHIRDRGNVVPYRQVQLLKDAGLVTLLGLKKYGGGEQPWSVAYRVVRIIAEGEGSLAQLLGYHYIWFWTATFYGTDDQRARHDKWLTENKYLIGGAVNPRDSDLKVAPSDGSTDFSKAKTWVFNGKKTFSTGSKVSDVTILEGALANDPSVHVFAPVISKQAGIVYGDEWTDVLGMRATQSGGVTIDNVTIDAKDALGFVNGQFQPLGPYNTTILPSIQVSTLTLCTVSPYPTDLSALAPSCSSFSPPSTWALQREH